MTELRLVVLEFSASGPAFPTQQISGEFLWILGIINQAGPLPVKQSFNSPMDGPALLVVTGSLWTTSANNQMQLTVFLDGTQIGATTLWSNGASTHRAMPTLFIPVNLTFGSHQLALFAGGNSVTSDLNDPFFAALIY